MLTPTDAVVKNADTKLISRAKADDERHRFFAESVAEPAYASPYYRLFLRFVEETIPARSKREQIIRQIAWPLVTAELVDDISDATAAVHYAQDRYIAVEMSDDKLQGDAEAYLERLDLSGFISRNCHTALFSAPNSMIVVDLPAEQVSDFPEPYFYLLSSDQLVRAEPIRNATTSAGMMQFVYFETDKKNRRGLFDLDSFAVYEKATGTEWTEVSRVPHSLGFTPVFKLWADIDEQAPLCSHTILKPVLGLLNRYVLNDASKEANDLVAANPMLWRLQGKECDYRTADGYTCQKGIIEKPVFLSGGEIALDMEPIRSACPVRDRCPRHSMLGPGSVIDIPAPQTKEEPDWRAPAGWINADVNNLNYVNEKVDKLRAKILATCTGSDQGVKNDQALNESQILSILESARQVGQYLADHFQTLHKRLIDTLLTLRYGPSYIGCTVNYGRRFTLLSGDQMQLLFESAQKTGSGWLMEEIDSQLQDFYARADASRRLRYRLLTDLNPYPFQSPESLIAAQQQLLNPDGFAIATNLMGFVRRFEREQNVSLERFGITTNYSNRLTQILTEFQSYVQEQRNTQTNANGGNDPSAGGPAGSPAGANG